MTERAPLPDSQADRPQSVSASLRVLTAEHHRRAEQSVFQRHFVRGTLPLPAYTSWLAQMLCVYRALEAHPVRAVLAARPAIDREPWRRVKDLERDLTHFGVVLDSALPLPSTTALLRQLSQWAGTTPAALLGVLYVLEGSTNGSRHIARVLRQSYRLPGGDGLRFMDPHGEKQPERWSAFKAALDAEVNPQEIPSLVAAAQATFDAVTAIGEELADRAFPSG